MIWVLGFGRDLDGSGQSGFAATQLEQSRVRFQHCLAWALARSLDSALEDFDLSGGRHRATRVSMPHIPVL
jgi:hypothetical protein